ncbi:unnamed protein product, partial [Rotaria sp. Silwood2]
EGNETPECAIAIANKNNADFIISTDSDADRFALIERDITGSAQTGWRILTGNLLGALLGNLPIYLTVDLKDVYMIYSTVSSHILKSIDEVKDFNTIDTLTDFK